MGHLEKLEKLTLKHCIEKLRKRERALEGTNAKERKGREMEGGNRGRGCFFFRIRRTDRRRRLRLDNGGSERARVAAAAAAAAETPMDGGPRKEGSIRAPAAPARRRRAILECMEGSRSAYIAY